MEAEPLDHQKISYGCFEKKVQAASLCLFVGILVQLESAHSVVSDSLQPVDCSLPLSMEFSKNTKVGSHSCLQGNLPNPGIKPWSPALQAESLPSAAAVSLQ